MRKLAIAALTLLVALPVLGQDRHQSYVTYDDGDSTLLLSDGREIESRVNLPVYPGDVINVGKRGRTEVRLSDGNVAAIDRYSRLSFESMLAAYDGDDTQTVARLLEGQVLLYRLYRGSEPLRLDTTNASYLASKQSLYGVEMSAKGVDLVTVFEGSIEVRTRQGAVELRAGDTAKIDLTGIYSRNRLVSNGATEFEQWFIRRAGRYSADGGRYLDSSLAYLEGELTDNGQWIYVNNSYVWRPHVSVGWRPYTNGYWHTGWGGSVVWVSYEPWGWGPYHYGRWGYHNYYGWVWYPGYGYSPAWVYWIWGPTYVGWAPAGWYDCYWGYRNWYYYPSYGYCKSCGYHRGYGFNGRVTISSKDLRAYTVVDRNVLFSNRIDRAALTADQVRNRLARDGNSGVLSNQGLRLNENEIRDPSRVADRIIRGSNGSGTGTSRGTGSPADVTSFFQRDPNPSADVRDRVTRGVPRATETTTTSRGTPSVGSRSPGSTEGSSQPGVVTRGNREGTVPRAGSSGSSGGTVTRGGNGETVPRTTPTTGTRSDGDKPAEGSTSTGPREGVVRPRVDNTDPKPDTRSNDNTDSSRPRTVTRPAPDTSGSDSSAGTERPRTVSRPAAASPTETRSTTKSDGNDTGTRGTVRPARPAPSSRDQPVSRAPDKPEKNETASLNDDWRRGNAGSTDPAQRVITTIGGARISPSGSDRSTSDTTASRGTSTKSNDTSSDWRTRGSFTSGSSSTPKVQSTGTGSSRGTTTRSPGVSRPSSGKSTGSSRTTTGTRSGSTKSSGSTRSSGSKSSSGGRAGMPRPSTGSDSSSGSSSGSSKSSKSTSSSSSDSGSSKVTRKPN